MSDENTILITLWEGTACHTSIGPITYTQGYDDGARLEHDGQIYDFTFGEVQLIAQHPFSIEQSTHGDIRVVVPFGIAALRPSFHAPDHVTARNSSATRLWSALEQHILDGNEETHELVHTASEQVRRLPMSDAIIHRKLDTLAAAFKSGHEIQALIEAKEIVRDLHPSLQF